MTVPFRDRTRLRMTVVGAIVVAAALALLLVWQATNKSDYKDNVILVYVDSQITPSEVDMIEASVPGSANYDSSRSPYRVVSLVFASDEAVCGVSLTPEFSEDCSDWDELADGGRFVSIPGYKPYAFDDDPRPSTMLMALNQASWQCGQGPTKTCSIVVIAPESCWQDRNCNGQTSDQLDALEHLGYSWRPIAIDSELGIAIPEATCCYDQGWARRRLALTASKGLEPWDDDDVDWVSDLPTAVETALER